MALITPQKVRFSDDVMVRLWTYVHKQIEYLSAESDTFRTVKIPEWTRLLKGEPKQAKKDFPFENASNLVVQLIATRVEQMLSRAMIIYGVDPLWSVTATGDLVGQEADDQARVLEQFMSDQAIDPEELNLYRKEELMWHDGIAYGTAFMGFPIQYLTEEQSVSIPGVSDGVTASASRNGAFETYVKKDGPSPENIPVTRILISNKVMELDKARFVARLVPLSREAVEDRIEFGVWSKDKAEKVLSSPDIMSNLYQRTNTTDSKNISTSTNEYDADYLIHECYFKFVHDGKMYSIIAHYHFATQTRLSCVFNYLPKNQLPLEDIRFGYDTDSYYGYGFIEMLKGYQHEVSTLHNNRLDNEAIRNSVTFRINKDSELASTIKFYPGVVIPADEGEVDVLETARAGALDNGQSESMSTSMTNERAGIDPAMGGNGSGIVNAKRGIYSSQGTMAVLQQQNNRTGLRMMDIRGSHTKIGRKLLDIYADRGIGKRLARYGAQSSILRKALDNAKAGNLGLILKASSASQNVESDRQNSILLQGLQEKYFGTINQLMQAMQQPQLTPEQKSYLQDVMFAEQSLTRHIFRIFGHFDVDKLVPFPESIKNERFTAQQQPKQQPGSQSAGSPQNFVPIASNSSGGTVPTSAAPVQGQQPN